jgi:hypothetical protein
VQEQEVEQMSSSYHKIEYVLTAVFALCIGFYFGCVAGYQSGKDWRPAQIHSAATKKDKMLAVYIRESDGMLFAENGYAIGLQLRPMREIKADIDAAMAAKKGVER